MSSSLFLVGWALLVSRIETAAQERLPTKQKAVRQHSSITKDLRLHWAVSAYLLLYSQYCCFQCWRLCYCCYISITCNLIWQDALSYQPIKNWNLNSYHLIMSYRLIHCYCLSITLSGKEEPLRYHELLGDEVKEKTAKRDLYLSKCTPRLYFWCELCSIVFY